MPYQITEPHPTTLPNHYVHNGRGGAGNTYQVSSPASKKATTSTLASTMSTISSTPSPSARSSTGRGGAGNVHPLCELPVFSFDEEINRQEGRERARVWHVGRGGAGNCSRKTSQALTGAERKNSNDSVGSNGSSRSGLLGRLNGALDRL